MAKLPPQKPKKKADAAQDDLVALYDASFISTEKFFVAPGRKNHLLEHYMPGPGNVTALVAPPGAGKTTLLANLAFQYAYKLRYKKKQADTGEIETTFGDFLGLRMTQPPGPVLFIAREGHRQLQLLGAHENEAMDPATLKDEEYFEPIVAMAEDQYLKLDRADSMLRLDKMIDAFIARHKRAPGLIILDTARKLLAGDENSSSDVSAFMQNCQTIAKGCNASVLIAHHTPKKGDTARGSGAWLADTDCEWSLSPKDKYVTVSVTKLKGFQLPPSFHFTIKPIDTQLPDLDNPGKFLSAAHIEAFTPPKKEEKTTGKDAAIAMSSSPEEKHARRQKSRLKTMLAAWESSGSEYTQDNEQYITRAALMEYLQNSLGYSAKTAQQALKPSANPGNKANIIGPLLEENLIASHEHGWRIITIENHAAPSATNEAIAKPLKKKAFPRKTR